MGKTILLVTAIVMVCLSVALFILCFVKRRSIPSGKGLRKVGRIVLSFLLVVTCVANFVALNFTTLISQYFTTLDLDDPGIQEVRANSTEVAKEISDEGIVLLKNENEVLPMKHTEVNVFGYSSIDINFGGTGSGSGSDKYNVGFYEGLANAGISVNEELKEFYNDSYTEQQESNVMAMTGGDYNSYEPSVDEYTDEMIANARDYSDTAIIVLTRNGGEGGDLPLDTEDYQGGAAGEHYLELNKNERDMVAMVEENFENIIVVINSSNAMELGFLDDEAVDAALWIGGPGCEGCNSLGEILVGTLNPSGRLADTYAYDLTSNPSYYNFGQFLYENTENQYTLIFDNPSVFNGEHYAYVDYAEGIYVGYRYYETRYYDSIVNPDSNADSSAGVYASANNSWNYSDEVVYGFGYGQSYTEFDFDITNFSIDQRPHEIFANVTVNVTNTGDVAGKTSVQVYAQSPYTDYDKQHNVEKSAVQLINFDKTDVLQPGASETVEIQLDLQNLASYDSTYENADGTKGTYIFEEGDYYFAVGNGAHDALNNILAAQGHDVEDGMDYAGEAALAEKWTYDYSGNGTIDAIVTDHAPHEWEEKDQEFNLAPSGFVGLETSVGAVLTYLYHTGEVDLMTIVNAMSTAQAKILRLDAGVIAPGKDADLTILDLDKEWTVDASAFYSKGKASPFDEMIFKGKAVATVVDGAFVMKDGEVLR